MDAIREQFEKPLVAGIAGLVVGIFIGLVVLGWGLFPVKWTNAAPADLRSDAREDYLHMAIDSYALNENAELAQDRWNELGETGQETLQQVQDNPGEQSLDQIQAFASVVPEGKEAIDKIGEFILKCFEN